MDNYNVNAAFTNADEELKEIHLYLSTMMRHYYGILQLNIGDIKPCVFNAILVWKFIKNNLKKVDEEMYKELKEMIAKYEKINLVKIHRLDAVKQQTLFDDMNRLTDLIKESIDALGIGIRILTKK